VTCTVSDGVNSGSITFTVRLVHPYRYYTDTSKSTYGTGDAGTRSGIVFVAKDGDFTGAPTGADLGSDDVYHVTLSSGEIRSDTFRSGGSGRTITRLFADGSTTNPSDFPYGATVRGVFLKGGETYTHNEELTLEVPGEDMSQLASWGTGKAILTNGMTAWSTSRNMWVDNWGSGFRPARFSGIDFFVSDFDVSDPTWRVWWNELNYDNKSFVGKFGENTNSDLSSGWYNGAILSDGAGGYTQVIRDDDNGNGTGTLICAQVVTGSNAISGDATTFADLATLTDEADGTKSCRFLASGSRQDRTR